MTRDKERKLDGRVVQNTVGIQNIHQIFYSTHSILSRLWQEIVIPTEFIVPTTRTEALDKTDQEQVLREQLLLAEEKRDVALISLKSHH